MYGLFRAIFAILKYKPEFDLTSSGVNTGALQ